MSINFHILGLFVIYLIMCMYYSNYIKGNRNIMFRNLLIVNFISQFLYLISFIVLNNDSISFFGVFIIKLFMAFLVILPSMFFSYVYCKSVKNKYLGKDTLYEKRVIGVYSVILVLDLILVLISFVLPISINNFKIGGDVLYYTYIINLIFIVMSLFLMIIHFKDIDRDVYVKLNISILISFVALIIQYCFSNVGVIASGYTYAILFIYLALENGESREINYLRVAKESAERLNVEKTEFLEKMSREIRTPLNTIDGFSQVIMDEDNIDNIREDVKDIRVASNNLIDMINGIMDISLIESGKMEISNYEYDSMEMFESISMIGKTLINKKNIDFKVEYSDNIPRVLFGDSEKIKRVLINLLNNAVSYTDKGEIIFRVQAVNSGSVCRLIMSVSDTGCGIKKSELGSIFNRYERVVGNQGSNGLGLAIVDSLVGLMNGKVDVDSVYGKGSVFTVTIDQKVIQSDSVTSSSNQNGRVNIFDAKGMRVLVVDDNKLNLKVACKLLSVYNVDVVEAMSGQEFLDIIDADRDFDLILMDDMMPKMSGTETLNIFKKIERVDGFDIPVVVLTANAISGMRDKYLKSGFDDYLAKPIDKYELNRVLKKYLKVNKNTRNIDNNDNNNVSSGSNRVRGHKINKRDYE